MRKEKQGRSGDARHRNRWYGAAAASLWLAGLLLFPALAGAQVCTQIPQRVTDSTASNSLAGWTVVNGDGGGSAPNTWTTNALGSQSAQHWDDQTNGTVTATVPTALDTMTQALTRVSGGAILEFELAWNNAQWGAAPNAEDGNQSRLVIRYNGVDYVEALTSPWQNRANTAANAVGAGPTTGAVVTALNGATLLSGSMPAPVDVNTPVFNYATIRIRLPANVAPAGNLVVGVQRVENGMSQGRTDDFYVRSFTVADRSLCIRKTTQNGTGAFVFNTTNLDTVEDGTTAVNNGPFTLTTATAGTPVAQDADAGVVGNQPALVMANQVVLAETPANGFGLVGATCDNGVTGSISGSQVTLSAFDATSDTGLMVTCTLTNARPRIRLQKALPNGRALAGDQFALTVAGPRNGTATTATATTTGSGSTATGLADFNPGDAGGSYTLSEAAAGTAVLASYATTYACTNATAGSPTAMPSGSGATFNLVPAAADDITCTFTNAVQSSDLTITKTNTPGVNGNVDQATDTVARGNAVNYSIVVGNAGPQAGNGAVLRDPAPTGLTCTTVNCSVTSGGAACPAAAALTIANLQSAGGVAIPSLPAASSLTFVLGCTVN